jgi:ADP-heptose:LPS heptosyltransferase
MLLWALRKTQFEAAVSQMNVNLRQFDLLLRVLRVGRRRTSVTALRDFTTQDSTVWDRHKVDLNIDLVTTVLDLSDQVNLAATWPSRVPRSNTAPRIALAPGSGEVEAHKRWPAARYAQLAVKIIAVYPDAEIRVYGAPNEAELCAEVAALSKEAATVAKVRSVTELFDAFCEVDICVANCNGASHVAAHAGAVVVGVYGPTQAEHTGAHASSMIKISRDLECSPCYRRGYITGCGDPICLTDLPDCRVADAVFAILEAG